MSSSSSSSREPSRGFAFLLFFFFFFFFSSFSASSHDRICLSSGVVLVPREDNALRRETRPRRRASFSSAERGRGEEWRGTERARERGREVWVAFSTAFFGFVGRFSECTACTRIPTFYRWSVHGWGTPFFSSLFELFYLFLLLPFVSLPFFFFGSFETLPLYLDRQKNGGGETPLIFNKKNLDASPSLHSRLRTRNVIELEATKNSRRRSNEYDKKIDTNFGLFWIEFVL